MRNITIIIKPTNYCNAQCIYCSAYKEHNQSQMMSMETLELVHRRIAEYYEASNILEQVTFCWHGGEPLLAGTAFYEKVLDLQKQYLAPLGLRVGNQLQSNMLLYSDKWTDILKRLLITGDGRPGVIGTSHEPLEGIRISQNKDYSPLWLDKIQAAERDGLQWGIVYVAHKKSLENVEYLYDVFSRQFAGKGVRINPLYKEGRAKSELNDYFITPRDWFKFLMEMYKLWEKDGKPNTIAPLREWDDFHRDQTFALSCEHSGRCRESHLGINEDGSVHGCGRWIDNGSMCYGNIHQSTLMEILDSSHRVKIYNRRILLDMSECGECDWYRYCHGGCPINPLCTGESMFEKNPWCEALKSFFVKTYGKPAAHAVENSRFNWFRQPQSVFGKNGGENRSRSVLLTVPPTSQLIDSTDRRLILYGDDYRLINEIVERDPTRIAGVDFTGSLDEFKNLKFGDKSYYSVKIDDYREVISNCGWLSRPNILVKPKTIRNIVETVKIISSVGINIDLIDLIPEMSLEDITETLGCYLYEQSAKAPIEPFHSVLSSWQRKIDGDLWRLTRTDPNQHIYLDDEGNLSASHQDLSDGNFYGRAGDQKADYSESQLSKKYQKFWETWEASQQKCITCRYMFFCKSWANYRKDDCDKWLVIFDTLQDVANRITNEIRLRNAQKKSHADS